MLALLVFGLSACATTPVARVVLPQPRLAPSALAMTVSLSQRLSFEYGDGAAGPQVLDAQLEIDRHSLHLAAFALGQRVLALHWDGERLDEQRGTQLPAAVNATQFLRDLQFVYAPLPALQAAMPEGWRVHDHDSQRELSWHGRSAIVIDYATMPRWQGRVVLGNQLEGYRLSIESVATAAESD